MGDRAGKLAEARHAKAAELAARDGHVGDLNDAYEAARKLARTSSAWHPDGRAEDLAARVVDLLACMGWAPDHSHG